MSQHDEIASVLGQVVELGPTGRQTELGEAVSRHVSARPAPGRRPDPETAAALRALAHDPPVAGGVTGTVAVTVNFNALYAQHGDDVWTILGRLKEMFE